ncbi:MAG: TIR domain-containing protein [Saprospiraceae bacterium]|nr:TIR domain-containing protein [Saprospiraceae bacterium]
MSSQPPLAFIIYAREDEPFRAELKAQLLPMERAGQLRVWTDRELIAGEHWEPAIKEKLKSADIILLLVSTDYFSSDYIHEVELKEAIERHNRGEARVLPVIVRPCDWEIDPVVSSLQVLPTDGNPVNDPSKWHTRETAWVDVVRGVRRTLQQLQAERAQAEAAAEKKRNAAEQQAQTEAERSRRAEQARAQAETRAQAEAEKRRQKALKKAEAEEQPFFPRRRALYALGTALLAALLYWAWPKPEYAATSSPQHEALRADWAAAKQANTIPAYRQFLSAHAEGLERDTAQQQLAALEQKFLAHRTDAFNLLNDGLASPALAHLDSMLRIWPGHSALLDARTLIQDGMPQEAAGMVKKAGIAHTIPIN